ncbi:hypothetical protein Sste5346_000825 [Sporothrix stenoceras]|uniref:Uncharacterized protein n=1 Tax=Sporothrix stenoceras TaxID=5173 RepID=A0ABR3ZQE7_9PEZI
MTCSLDTYIYSQGPDVAPLPPPPHVTVMSKERLEAASAAVAAPLPTAYPLSSSAASSSVDSSSASASASAKKALDYVYAHIDPRVHWTRARPKDWHDAKQKEIKARGGRKANFGKAAQRAAAARRKAAVAAAAEATAAAALESVESPMGNAATEPETYGGSVANTRSARQKEKAPAKPPPPAPVVAAPPPQVPSVWTGELPAEVTSNKPWMSLLGKFAQDEEAWRTAKQSTTQKSSGRSKRH